MSSQTRASGGGGRHSKKASSSAGDTVANNNNKKTDHVKPEKEKTHAKVSDFLFFLFPIIFNILGLKFISNTDFINMLSID